LLFARGTKGIAFDSEGCTLRIVDVVDGDWQAAGVTRHDVKNRALAHMLIDLHVAPAFREFPMALGVIYDDPRPTFESAVHEERQRASAGKIADLAALLGKGQTWTVKG
ncbi:MAG: 2-oxoacid:ferredoxin oxidoreductase subunit beta, partial [Novosphingobium sp.]|nr:2-oxoacid:ferredoxin oxidoreductase subunit beta [Novosphingobium sp.]